MSCSYQLLHCIYFFGIVHVKYINNRQKSHCIHWSVYQNSFHKLLHHFYNCFLNSIDLKWIGFDIVPVVVVLFCLVGKTFIFIWWLLLIGKYILDGYCVIALITMIFVWSFLLVVMRYLGFESAIQRECYSKNYLYWSGLSEHVRKLEIGKSFWRIYMWSK